MYPLQMTDIPDCPFDKIAIDLTRDLNVSTLRNQHVFTIIDYLMGWPESFPISNKKADIIIYVFINSYLPVHMCPKYILSDNRKQWKNQLMNNIP